MYRVEPGVRTLESGTPFRVHGTDLQRLRIRHTGGEQLVPVTMHVSSVGIPTVESPAHIKVYPNPTSGRVFVQHESAIIEKVTVTDLYGRTVAAVPVNDYQTYIDLSILPSGIYLLKIGIEDGGTITTKVIKSLKY